MSRTRAPRRPNGRYRMCTGTRGCGGKGYRLVNGKPKRHKRCGGDGWIKIGTKGRRRRRAAGALGGATVVWFGLGDMLGTVGYVIAAVLIVAAVAIKLLGATVRLVTR